MIGIPSLKPADRANGREHPAVGEVALATAMDIVRRQDLSIIALGDGNEPVWISEGARRWLRPPQPVYLAGDRLCFDERLGTGGMARLRSRFGDERRQVLLGDPAGNDWVLMSGWYEEVAGERLLVTTYRMAVPPRTCLESGLSAQFRLTKAQCAVLDLFARLMPPREIADELGLTVHTVRSHLKTIHAKVGVRSNMQLLQIVRAYCDA